jgi:ABC-type dipeptide/oligopeptide/nickel transport system ATPase component
MSLLEVKGLGVQFGETPAAVHAVNHVSFSVERGETVALVGESGSGKSVTGLALVMTVLGFLLVGDGLRDAFDVKDT